jgi:ribulose-phosphate 3-epimerase
MVVRNKMRIIPTILEQDFVVAEEKIRLVKDLTSWIQIDVIDGVYTSKKTFETELITRLNFEASNLLWDFHLMVKEPIKWIEKCLFAGASRVIGQVEMMNSREEFVRSVIDTGMEAGLGFDIETEIGAIPTETEVVLLMGRKAGFGSFEMAEIKVLEKVKELIKQRQEKELNFKIGVDGGVTANNLERLKEAGVEIFYAGGAIFNGNVEGNWHSLEEKLK